MAIGSSSETAFLASEDRARLELAFLLRVSTSGTTTACTIPSLKDILILPPTNSHVLVFRTKDHRALYTRLRFRSGLYFIVRLCPYLEAETESGIRLVDSSHGKYYRIQRLAFICLVSGLSHSFKSRILRIAGNCHL